MVGEAPSSRTIRDGAILFGPVLKDLPRIDHFIASTVVESFGGEMAMWTDRYLARPHEQLTFDCRKNGGYASSGAKAWNVEVVDYHKW
jgi:hypothetical protein